MLAPASIMKLVEEGRGELFPGRDWDSKLVILSAGVLNPIKARGSRSSWIPRERR
jgi:hypothetical protein